MGITGIEWTDQVWNPIRGCSMVSSGCANCYAMKFAGRFSGKGQPYEGLVGFGTNGVRWTGRIMLVSDKLEDPIHWRKPRRVFVNSMSDLFHEEVPDNYIADVFDVMGRATKHTFQILTKRSSRMVQWFGSWAASQVQQHMHELGIDWPLQNVWLGVSAEHQDAVDLRVPDLLSVPAAIRFVSAEPLLGTVDLERVECPVYSREKVGDVTAHCGMCMEGGGTCCSNGYFNALVEGIDWIIVGCETGPKSRIRPMNESWVHDLCTQCQANSTSFFYKQAKDGNGKTVSLPLLDGTRWSQFPNERKNNI